MTNVINSLMSGGFEPDYGEAYDNAAAEIENQYIVVYQDNGDIYKNVFTVFEDDDPDYVLAKALDFANTVDTLLLYQELYTQFYNPKTGEPVETPVDSAYIKHYYDQPIQPYQIEWAGLVEVDEDDLPF